ncbi:MAG: four helix bundle protein [Crocinitomicaceae bacterium]
MHRYKDLKFWKESKDLSVEIYHLTARFPKEEKFGIVNQMRRASVSIPSNIAEGSTRNSNKDFSRFLDYSMGSAYELETQMEISKELGFLKQDDHTLISMKLNGIIKQMSKFRINCLS